MINVNSTLKNSGALQIFRIMNYLKDVVLDKKAQVQKRWAVIVQTKISTIKSAHLMSKYEYKVIELKIKEKLLQSSAPEVTKILNKEGEEGWRFVQFIIPFARQLSGWIPKLLVLIFNHLFIHNSRASLFLRDYALGRYTQFDKICDRRSAK